MGSLIVVGSFPPVIGISTSMMLCGFAWGVQGIFIVAPAATLGACLAFVLLRLFFRKKVKNWTQNVKKWEALESVIEARGLPLIILIRWAPLPWVYSNSFFSSIEAVSLWQFLVATVCFWPKFLLHVFIGSRIALFSDGQQRGEMDALTKALNILSIIVSSLVGMGTGWYVWRLTNRRIKELEALRGDIDEEEGLSNLGEAEAEAPLLRGFSVGIMAIEEEEDRRRSYSPL
ncbi:hypothetical protein BOTBODRAFT_26787 [Botryobasidium botryosum FD-172 SS1]|uniref:Golgi apparatus membrane protein TVP38 n=1 Tax=Botryobasidium botryosum (strain FD-172 SS1) TaxID=930990 RepID=A0A067MYT1_BOTB1|nr:hypothetical protein BOTBODRAFT_26787 [Botryobasidium botryosum FD-172 SS1]